MVRRIAGIIVLLSLTLHSASRTGVLSYLYSNRHTIAHFAGLIAEKPITLCDSHYFQTTWLVADQDENNEAGIVTADEINLFTPPISSITVDAPKVATLQGKSAYFLSFYNPPSDEIFHPPLV